MMLKKIGLAGKSGSGKDVVADMLCDYYGYQKIAVADGIREECSDFLHDLFAHYPYIDKFPESFEVVRDAFDRAVFDKPTSPEIRVLLQWWGTEYRRSQDTDYWVKRLDERLTNDAMIVVSDIRTPAEIESVHRAGGEVWFIDRPGVADVGLANHYTEVALSGVSFDRMLYNHGTLDDLSLAVRTLWETI